MTPLMMTISSCYLSGPIKRRTRSFLKSQTPSLGTCYLRYCIGKAWPVCFASTQFIVCFYSTSSYYSVLFLCIHIYSLHSIPTSRRSHSFFLRTSSSILLHFNHVISFLTSSSFPSNSYFIFLLLVLHQLFPLFFN